MANWLKDASKNMEKKGTKRIMFALNAGKIARAGLTPALAAAASVCAPVERAD